MKRLLLASNNAHKVHEFRALLRPHGLEIVTPAEIGLELEVEETGETFEENAALKAEALSAASGLPALADDSGLAVDALDGEPGVRSARFGDPGFDDLGRCRLVLDRLAAIGASGCSARFVCVLALAMPGRPTQFYRGEVEGTIAPAPRGSKGFGYDPIFHYVPAGKTFGELAPAEKGAVSHRSRAISRLVGALTADGGEGILSQFAEPRGGP